MWLLKISLILVGSLLKVGPGKTKKSWKSHGKVMEFSHKKGVWTVWLAKINGRENKGESKMDNPERVGILGTQDTEQRQTQQSTENYRDDPTTNPEETQVFAKCKQFLSLSY